MKARYAAALMILAWCGARGTPAQDTSVASHTTSGPETVRGDDSGRFRVSALIKTEGGVKVGVVDREGDRSYYLREGERSGDLEIVSADYQREAVVIRYQGRLIRFELADDPSKRELFLVNPPATPTGTPDPQDRDLYPEHDPLMPDPPPPTSLGPGIDAFLKENPELARELQKPQGRYGSGIESMIRLYPDLQKKLDEPPADSGLGPAIDALLKEHPELQESVPSPAPQGR
jgi:hypothetical protein